MKKYKNRNLNWVLLDVYCEDEDYEEYDLNEETFMLIDYVKNYDFSVEYYID